MYSVGTLMSVARLVLRCNFYVPLFVRIQCKYSVMRLEVLLHDTVQSCENWCLESIVWEAKWLSYDTVCNRMRHAYIRQPHTVEWEDFFGKLTEQASSVYCFLLLLLWICSTKTFHWLLLSDCIDTSSDSARNLYSTRVINLEPGPTSGIRA